MAHKFLIDGIAPGSRVAVAMSGGVDSSVAASLMAEAGYDVVGITLQLYDHGEILKKKGTCCAGQDIYDAKMVADRMGFPHYVLNYESLFRQKVMEDFVDSYMAGETPIPCVKCNQKVKFEDLLKMAKDLGAVTLVTGHYVQRLKGEARAELHRAVDPTRDQSYFLFATTQDQLDYLSFPLGGILKSETRDHARRFGLEISDKPDSQDICFVPNGHYASVVEKLRPGALDAGNIVHMDGTLLGKHQGIINYTIGQRKGLGIASSDPLYVIKIDPLSKQVIVGPRAALAKRTVMLRDVNWLEDESFFEKGKATTVKIRSTNEPLKATLTSLPNQMAEVTFDSPEYGVSSGQACVFYDGERVLGGGWITSSQD